MCKLNEMTLSSLVFAALAALPAIAVVAAEMDHSHMHSDQHQSTVMPAESVDQETMNHDMHMEKTQDEKTMTSDSGHHAGHDITSSHGQHTGQHMAANPKAMSSEISLQPLMQLPPSGKAREAGYDGRYAMENTSIDLSLSAKCALASRGLVMLDKASRSQCDGKSNEMSNEMPAASPSGMHDHHRM